MALRVQTIVAPSNIEGLGLFAAERIPKDTLVWEWDDTIDYRTEHPTAVELDIGWKWGAICEVPGDDARYINHSASPNTRVEWGEDYDRLIAVRDIQAGEEITESYDYDQRFDEFADHLK